VNPDVDSKKALINEGIVLLIMYGRDPNTENKIHDITTTRKVSLMLISSGFAFLLSNLKSKYREQVTTDDQRNGRRDSL